jgi:hypothetical protein
MLAWKAEQKKRRNDSKIWEYHIAKAEENKRRAREAEHEGTTSETWPPPRPEESTFYPRFVNLIIEPNSFKE